MTFSDGWFSATSAWGRATIYLFNDTKASNIVLNIIFEDLDFLEESDSTKSLYFSNLSLSLSLFWNSEHLSTHSSAPLNSP